MKLSVRELDVAGKRVLVRVDFNVPTEEKEGRIVITDDTRIRESLPTIELLREKGAKVILMAHFGRPKGKPVAKYSLRPVADHLHTLINHPVAFSPETIGVVREEIISHMQPGDVCLLENVRFHAEEEENADGSRKELAKSRRYLRQRRIRRRPPRPCVHRRNREIRAPGRHGPADGEGVEIPRRRTRKPEPDPSW